MTDSESKAALGWRARVLIAIGLAVIVLPVLYVAAVMIGLRAHSKYDCRLQLRNIGVRLREHAAIHDGQFPAKWSELEWDDMGGIENTTWPLIFCCPTVGHEPGNWDQVDLWSDYRLIPGRTTNDPPSTVLAIEPLSNHETGANVLFVEGSSAWWPQSKVLRQKQAPTDAK